MATYFLLSLGCHSKQYCDEHSLTDAVFFLYLSYLSFPHHVLDLISLQCVPRTLIGKEAKPRLDKSFDESMILFDDVVQVLDVPQFAPFWNGTRRFHLLEGFGVGCVFIDRNDARSGGMKCSERFREEAFGRVTHLVED